jgi:hypothetical protein
MKKRIPRKLKKGIRSLLYQGDTKWKRKARNNIQKDVKGFALGFVGNGVQLFEPGGIVSDKPVSNRGEYVVTNEQRQRLEEMLRREPEPETVHISINLDDLTMAEKRKILRK